MTEDIATKPGPGDDRVTEVAKNYYDSDDADNFYAIIWGGEDIHVGLYSEGDSIKEASRKTVERMAGKLEGLDASTRIIDIGAGYGGAARYIADRYGAHVTCLNLSDKENDRNRKLNKEQGLAGRIDVVGGSFEDIPEPDDSFDVVWSQDAILHSGNRRRVLEEVTRVIKPGGQFILTDPMQADNLADETVLQPIYDRIHLSSLASVAFYRRNLADLGFTEIAVEDLTHQLRNHYASVKAELSARRDELTGHVSEDYIERMLKGLQHWVDGADKGYLAWGILHFRKK